MYVLIIYMDTCKDVTGNSNLMLDSFGLNHFLKFVKKKNGATNFKI